MSKLEQCKKMIKIAMKNKSESPELIARVDSVTDVSQIYDLLLESENMPLGFTYGRIDKIMGPTK